MNTPSPTQSDQGRDRASTTGGGGDKPLECDPDLDPDPDPDLDPCQAIPMSLKALNVCL